MLIHVTAPASARLLAAAVRRALRVPLLLSRVAGVAAVVAGASLRHGYGVALMVVGVLLAVAFPIAVVAVATRRAVGATPLTTYEISDGGVATASDESRHSYSWRAFTHVDRLPGQLLFAKSRVLFMPVPTSSLSPSQVEQVLGAAAFNGVRVRRA